MQPRSQVPLKTGGPGGKRSASPRGGAGCTGIGRPEQHPHPAALPARWELVTRSNWGSRKNQLGTYRSGGNRGNAPLSQVFELALTHPCARGDPRMDARPLIATPASRREGANLMRGSSGGVISRS